MAFKGVTGKLWLAMVTLVLLVLGSFSLVLNFIFADFYINQKLDSLKVDAQTEAKSLTSVQTYEELQNQVNSFHYTESISAIVLSSPDQVLAIGGRMHGMGLGLGMTSILSPTSDDFAKIMGGTTIAKTVTLSDGSGLAMAATQLKLASGGTLVLVLNTPLAPIQESINSFRRLLSYGAGVAVVLATLFALWLSRTMTTPLVKMNQIARKMSRGDFSDRLEVTTKDEIGDLGNSLNSLAEDLDKYIKLLSREKEQLGGILASMGDAVITMDEAGNLVQANPPAVELWQEDVQRKAKIIDCLRQGVQEVNTTGKSVEQDLEIGTQILNIHMEPLQKVEDYGGGVAVIRDVTAGHRQEKLRRELMATISHELRTPIHLVQAHLEALADGLVPAQDQHNYLELSLQEVLRLGRLVGDLQEINRLERGFPIVQNQLDVGQLAREVGEKYYGKADSCGVSLSVQSESIWVYGDKDRLTQVIVNLLENALRYTSAGGGILINVHADDQQAVLQLSDTGTGIKPEHLPYIWESFFRGDKQSKNHMGLGLTIVKRIIEAHGGTITAASDCGRGTTFTIRLPRIEIE